MSHGCADVCLLVVVVAVSMMIEEVTAGWLCVGTFAVKKASKSFV
jgi:hypothetical protein